MTRVTAKAFFLLLAATSPMANASGPISPANSQLTYAFSCPSGAHGQIAYTQAVPAAKGTRFRVAVVNGAYLHDDPRLVTLLAGNYISSVSAGCEGDTALVFLETWRIGGDPDTRKGVFTIYVDKSGVITSAQP